MGAVGARRRPRAIARGTAAGIIFNRGVTKKKEEAVVQHDLMRLEVKKLKENLNTRADQVFGLENRKFQLQKSLEQRMQEIAIQRAALVADLKLADDDRHRLVIENKEREIKVQTLQTRCVKLPISSLFVTAHH